MSVRTLVSLLTRNTNRMDVSTAVDRFIGACGANSLKPATIRWYEQRLSRMARFMQEQGVGQIQQVTADDIRSFVNHLHSQTSRWVNHKHRPSSEGSLSLYTIHSYVRVLHTFFGWLVEEQVIESNLAKRIKLPNMEDNPPKDITSKDLEKLMQAAEPDPRDYAIVCFLADTGCRVGGLTSLTLSNLYMDEGRAIVLEKGRGREKEHIVYFNGRTRDALRRLLDARPETDNEHVFLGQKGSPLKPSGVYQVLKRLAKATGVTGRFNPHSFRHHWAHHALKKGANLGDVSQVLGHSDVSVTIRFYGKWSEEDLKERHSKASPLKDDNRD